MTIRVALADDQNLIRKGLAYIIASQPDMAVAGEAADGDGIVLVCEQTHPDVVLMDIQMPKRSGIEATAAILSAHPAVRIILLTTFDVEEYVADGMRAGAAGYLLKGAETGELLEAIRGAHRGEAIYRTSTAQKAILRACRLTPGASGDSGRLSPLDPLTDRELEVLQQMAYGLKNHEISSLLHLSEGTVKTHVHRVLQKLGVEDRTQAVVFAIRNGLVK